jgi:hypothetical protein
MHAMVLREIFRKIKMKKIYKIISRKWTPGDLVKIKAADWDGSTYNSIGIVMRGIEEGIQASLFPAVLVYDTIRQEQRALYLYDVELISAAS